MAINEENSRLGRLRKSIVGLLLTLGFLTSLTLAGAPTANAYLYNGGGNPGPYTVSPVKCQWKIFGTSSNLVMTAQPPRVWAFNARSGFGNDASYVRYQAYVVDARNGNTLERSGYSGWFYATDITPANFTWTYTATKPYYGSYYIDYRIEWSTSTAATAWVAERHGSYNYIDQYNTGPFGKTSCRTT